MSFYTHSVCIFTSELEAETPVELFRMHLLRDGRRLRAPGAAVLSSSGSRHLSATARSETLLDHGALLSDKYDVNVLISKVSDERTFAKFL